ncbi:Tetratricopeptide repeat-containing protein [Pedobacter sp. ok626]|uniref:tetratricopeptide repeat-containing sensor histidine kinase n=1 Tax=Pedobacter sp. ok626 TaxID=1761882 RepID=UPI000880F16D|nr:tetratricopeptide repeat-containing sensor histidine kinase [Pedobacter sp. ok626]SDK40373.1 Tetratricopeptide repeat-containing protein [Pedobacter sp. ok626]
MKRYTTPLLLFLLYSCHQDRITEKVSKENPYYDRAWYFSDHHLPDSSFLYFNKAKEKALKDNDSVKVAKSLINMAIISGDRGDFFGSQEISLSAIKYLDPKVDAEREILSSNYNNLGKMASRLKHDQESAEFLLKAIEFSNKEASRNIYLNNLAANLTDQHKYDEALQYFNKLIATKSIQDDPITFSRILSNISKTKWLQNPLYNPVPDFLKALHIRQKENDLFGLNASLAHLTDFYMAKKPDSAIVYAHRMYLLAQQIKSADDQLYALERLIKLSPHQQSKQYFETYKKLQDSLETDRNAAKNQFAVIRYETEKSKADNLNLQKDNVEKKYQITKQKFLLAGTFVLIVASVVIFALWYKKRKQKLALESKAAIRENQLKIHKKVHDVVANGLYRMMSEIENREEVDKESILDDIEVLYEKSRDITYEEHPVAEHNFQEKINSLMASFGANDRRISFVGNDDALWNQVSPKAKHEIEYILQELMVNMKKHSGANNVVVRFERSGNQVNIYYMDDGVGIKGKPNFKNGLTNTGNRICSIGGAITFDTEKDRGLSIHISFTTT